MSPRAACRLAALGFTTYDYVPGKVDWLAHNLPVEGTATDTPTIGARLRHDVATTFLEEPVAAVRTRVAASPYDFALVLAADRSTLLGRLRPSVLDSADPDRPAGAVMEPGPSTLRPHEPVQQIGQRLADRHLTYAIVTDPEGHLLGTVHPSDLH